MLIFCAIILYSLYLMECSYATEKIQLCNCNTEKIEDVKEKIQQMKNAEPIVWYITLIALLNWMKNFIVTILEFMFLIFKFSIL